MGSYQNSESKKRVDKVVKSLKEVNLPAQNSISTEIILPNPLPLVRFLRQLIGMGDKRRQEPDLSTEGMCLLAHSLS